MTAPKKPGQPPAPADDLGVHTRPPEGMIFPPSHVTRGQAVRILAPLAESSVYWHSRPGGHLQAEVWHGTMMIPTWRVISFISTHPEIYSCPATSRS